MVCNPNNPTGSVLTEDEMDADRARSPTATVRGSSPTRSIAVPSCDGDATTPTFWGRYERVVVTSGLSKAFAMPGLRVGWAVAPPEMIGRIWERHDYTTLTPGMVSDRLAALAMMPGSRDQILARTRSIIRANYPRLEAWLDSHADDASNGSRPTAGAIAFAKVQPARTTPTCVERIRPSRACCWCRARCSASKTGSGSASATTSSTR